MTWSLHWMFHINNLIHGISTERRRCPSAPPINLTSPSNSKSHDTSRNDHGYFYPGLRKKWLGLLSLEPKGLLKFIRQQPCLKQLWENFKLPLIGKITLNYAHIQILITYNYLYCSHYLRFREMLHPMQVKCWTHQHLWRAFTTARNS